MIYVINCFAILVSLRLKQTYLITRLYFPILFAAGDWCFAALIWRAAKRENPNNPVNPVKKKSKNRH
jgi:hypothetical protein